MEKMPEVTCYLCKRTFQKRVEGAAHNRNYYRCRECLTGEYNAEEERQHGADLTRER